MEYFWKLIPLSLLVWCQVEFPECQQLEFPVSQRPEFPVSLQLEFPVSLQPEFPVYLPLEFPVCPQRTQLPHPAMQGQTLPNSSWCNRCSRCLLEAEEEAQRYTRSHMRHVCQTLQKCQTDHLKFPFFPSLFRPRPQRCGSSPSWTSLTPWASLTARPTCRPWLLLVETSTPLLRDCWAHSPLKDIQYNLSHRHMHTYMSDA